MSVDKRISRFFKLYKYLIKNKATVDSIYAWLLKSEKTISKRQVYRDLYDLQNALLQIGINLETEKAEKNKIYWFINESSKNNNISAQDLKAFYLLKNFAGTVANSLMVNELENIETVLLQHTKSNNKFDVSEFKNNILQTAWGNCTYSEKELKLISNLLWAIENKRWVTISFNRYKTGLAAESNHQGLSSKVLCCKLLQHRETLHAIFLNEALNQAYIFEIEEIQIKLTNELCLLKKVNLKTQIDEAINKRFGVTVSTTQKTETIKLLFGKSTSPFIEKRFWHSSQQFKYNNKQELLLTLKVPINRELVGWVLMWINHVKVIAPKKLQQIILQKVNDIQTLYTEQKPPFNNINPRYY